MLLHRGHCAYLTTTLCLSTFFSLCAGAARQNTTNTPGYTLLPGVSSVPTPITVAPDQGWDGIDGAWNTFSIRLGSQQSISHVSVSTASQQIWVVNLAACEFTSPDPSTNKDIISLDADCERGRGSLFNTTQSSTWKERGYYHLWIGEKLGLVGNGYYGFDAVGLGNQGEEGPTVDNTTISTLNTYDFWLGHLGLHPKPTNFSQGMAPVPSYMTRLFEQGSIPSLSFGYTAGVQYYDATFLGSLTLGGYDSSRYVSNNLSFGFSPDNERDLVVGLAGLSASTTTRSNIGLLTRTDVTLYIDSTVAEIWLPVEICAAFEDAFGLIYDNTTHLYLVDDLLHETLLAENPSVTFTLNQAYASDGLVEITLPYAAFDLKATPPYRTLKETTNYFPLRRGADKDQWILGKTFLQEAYITVDWERSRFSLYQCDWTYGKPSSVIPIVSPTYAKVSDPVQKTVESHTGVTVGVTIGCVLLLVFVATALAGTFWRRRCNALAAKHAADAEAARKASPTDTDEAPSSPVSVSKGRLNVFPKAELPAESGADQHGLSTEDEKQGSLEVMEIDNNERRIYEMLGDVPAPLEAASRQLSEKEAMMVREKKINGVDPNVSTRPIPAITRATPITSLDDIARVNSRLPNHGVSLVTLRAPRDGAHLEAGDTYFQLPPYRALRADRSADDLFSPIPALEAPTPSDSSRRRFSYES
ncbi:uncharacterized protein EKO05_0010439 [Ascochyta rabiei]|uniref:uncharacterized protein n=1 Tax=Didymella rabiei TaxID=5454 RepID=UPI0021F9B3CC|nr:uncharacterized protein EKO05_0010439 [Ascochyta rabiei]UPX20199.1 hypothetical protein EKO05_0010439 [Ascochyta rabiei]